MKMKRNDMFYNYFIILQLSQQYLEDFEFKIIFVGNFIINICRLFLIC